MSLSDQVIPATNDVIKKQNDAQAQYHADINDLSAYAVGNYRGKAWDTFKPDEAASLAKAKKDSTFPKVLADGKTNLPSELDWAQLQALLDQMKVLQPRLVASCVSAGTVCDPKALAETADYIETATSALALLQDNFKSIQTQQAAVYAGFTALEKIRTDFDARVKTGMVKKYPPDDPTGKVIVPPNTQILYMPIVLGKDYGTTDTGTISCTTTTTPAVATTDAINYTGPLPEGSGPDSINRNGCLRCSHNAKTSSSALA